MRYAICNETFENWPHDRVCATAAELGYTGLEVAPFTIAPRVTDVSLARRQEMRKQAEAAGIPIIGLHWLLAKTEGFHLTSADLETRKQTAAYLGEQARLCRDLGGSLMVFGSPAQRRIPEGYSHAQATEFAIDTYRRAADAFADAGVMLLLEPLSPPDADFLMTAAEACDMLRKLAHPSFALHLDVRAMTSEATPRPELIRRHKPEMKHFHANDANKRGPGFGDVDFVPIFQALKETEYSGWVSVEVFDYTPDPVTIARESIRYMRECEAKTK
jgi:sugar phosphate isomerase/epimerase